MSTREQFLPSKWITNPKHLPVVTVENAYLSAKYANTTRYTSDNALFFDTLDKSGAQAAITVADTFVTVCDLTGGGFITSLVSPSHSAAFTPTIKITVDGVVYTLTPSGDITAAERLVIGAITPATQLSADGSSLNANGSYDYGFAETDVSGISRLRYGVGIPQPNRALADSKPVLRFNSTCKVEMKASLLSADAVQKQCAVTYRMDI